MSRQDANAAFALTSFLYGSNAPYIEDAYARFQRDPSSVDAEWRDFFQSLKDQSADIKKAAEGPSWEQPNWPQIARDDTLSALDGNWVETGKVISDKLKAKSQASGADLSAQDVQQATRDSVHA